MNKTYCSICGFGCSGKMKIKARKNKEYPVCSHCFIKYEFTNIKEIRRLIRKSSL